MTLQDCLEYCQKQNGLDYCKNCGLTATIIHHNLAEEQARLADKILDIIQNIDWIEKPRSAFGSLNDLLASLDKLTDK